MSEIIPAYSPIPECAQASAQKTGADLAPVCLTPSRRLWLAQIIVLCMMSLSASVAVIPFIFSPLIFNAIYLPIIWLIYLLVLLHAGRVCWRVKNEPQKVLSIQNNIWRLRDLDGERIVKPCDQIVLWSWVIILPVAFSDGKKIYLLALRDSLDEDAWRRLRVWLRVSFKNQG